MAVKPNPYKLVCQKCGFSKVVAPRSDALSAKDIVAMSSMCKKCNNNMIKTELSFLDKLFSKTLG